MILETLDECIKAREEYEKYFSCDSVDVNTIYSQNFSNNKNKSIQAWIAFYIKKFVKTGLQEDIDFIDMMNIRSKFLNEYELQKKKL